MSDTVEKLNAAIRLSEEMLQAASQQQWSTVTELQDKRKILLEATFPIQSQDNQQDLSALIENIIDLNQQLETVCLQAKQAVQTELRGLNKNKKAVAAYQSS